MYASHWQGKLLALSIALLFLIATLLFILIASAPKNNTQNDTNAQTSVQVVDAPAACNAIVSALGGCE